MSRLSGCGKFRNDSEALLRAHGVGVGIANSSVNKASFSHRQFPLQLDDSQLNKVVALLKKASRYAILAHAPKADPQVSPKHDAWEWVARHDRLYLDSPPDVSFNRRGTPGGMADTFDRAPVALERLTYALH